MSIHERTETPELARATARGGPPLVATRVERITRAADQLVLTIELLNLDVDRRTNTVVQVDPREPFTGVRLGFGSQHTVEDTIPTAAATPAEGVDHRTARDSRLVFPLAPGTRYALEVLLDLAARALSLDERAVPGAKSRNTAEPSTDVTALEVVESLIFSPDPAGRFQAAAQPITHGDVTELWRARLEPGPAAPTPPGQRPLPARRPGVLAIFSRPGDPAGLDRPVTSAEREKLVAATVTSPGEPILVDRLWLTSQGSFLDLSGIWSGDLTSYGHRSTAGRDLHVEVVARGYLAPFGHPATITTVTERQFRSDAVGETSAILVRDDYLAVGAGALAFPAPHMPHAGRAIPFTDVSAVPIGSGPVQHATLTLSDGRSIDPEKAWAVTRGGADVQIAYTGTDRTGRGDIGFTLPAVFVTDAHAYTVLDTVNGVPTPLGQLADYYADAPARRAVADLGGQTIGWATPHPRGPAGSDRATTRVRIALDRPEPGTAPAAVRAELEQAGRPAFYPRVVHADVVDEATAALTGGDGSAVRVRSADVWLEHGIADENPGLAFHTLLPAGEPERAERTGTGAGLVRPSLNVTTFSQTLGAGTELTLADGARAADGPIASWDPAEALADTALLFGRIALASLLEVVNTGLDQLENERGMPRFEVLLEEDGLHYLMTWEPHLRTFSINGQPVLVVDKDLSRASLRIEQLIPLDSATAAGSELELELEHITLRLPPALPVIEIDFRSVRCVEPMGGTGQLQADLADWRFIEVLEFLEPVRELVVGLLDFASVEVGPDGISVDVEVPAPAVSLGVIGVTDLTVGLRLDLPNEGDSRIEFNLSRRDDPFTITLLGFGGSASLELGLVADDLDYLYAELAVTYEAAISLIVVSASLSAALGLELAYEVSEASGEREVTLSAYVELAGNASVLGLVNLTGKVLLALRYGLTSQLLQGTAQMSAEIDSIFGKSEAHWSQTVDVALGSGDADRDSARAQAAVAGPAPSFADRFSPVQWTTYCATFA